LNLQAGGVTVARALLVELHATSTGRLFERALLLGFSAVLTPSGWFATVDHGVGSWLIRIQWLSCDQARQLRPSSDDKLEVVQDSDHQGKDVSSSIGVE
jgi:hypothetical protein